MNSVRQKINNQYRNNEFKSYNDYKNAFYNEFNNLLVNNHNSLLAGQKQFGYTYTLERKK